GAAARPAAWAVCTGRRGCRPTWPRSACSCPDRLRGPRFRGPPSHQEHSVRQDARRPGPDPPDARHRYTSPYSRPFRPYPAMRGRTIAPAVPEWTYSARGIYRIFPNGLTSAKHKSRERKAPHSHIPGWPGPLPGEVEGGAVQREHVLVGFPFGRQPGLTIPAEHHRRPERAVVVVR